jgi:hypothetical protein
LAGAIAAQQGITSLAEGPADRGLRIGLDTGQVEWRDGRHHGAVLERAPRVLRAAHPGQILCSEWTAALARLDLDPRVRLTDLGVYRLSEGAAPEHLFQAEAPGWRRDFPPPVALAGHPGHLPSPLTRFFGREDELARLQEMLTVGARRLVTVLGPSGIGKTRLALEAGKRLVEPFRGAVWFVSLAEVADPERILDAVLRALGTEGEPSRDPFHQVAEALSLQPGLLILDNLEHLLGAGLMVNGSMVHGSTISHQPSTISH